MNPVPRITRRMIALIVAREFEVTLEDLVGTSRLIAHVRARFAVWHVVRKFRPETSTTQLGQLLRKDHTTARHGLFRAEDFLASDPDFADRVKIACGKVAECAANMGSTAELIFRKVETPAKVETPPAVVFVAPTTERTNPRPGTVDYSDQVQADWFRENDLRFRQAMESVRVQAQEAAE